MLFEWLLFAMLLALGVRTLGIRAAHAKVAIGFVVATALLLAIAVSWQRDPRAPAPIAGGLPGFATSNACRSCHPAEYASWHASFHRSMTQSATQAAAAAPQLRQGGRLRFSTGSRTLELYAEHGLLRALLPDPRVAGDGYEPSFNSAPMRDVQVKLLTGSHHHQAFWVRGARQGELRALPIVYSLDEGRLLARREAFLNPPDQALQAVRWNSNCVQCHAVAGEPRHDLATDTFNSAAAELGIACEACHGQSAEHVRAMQNPLARYRAHATKGGGNELRVINPADLTSERSSQVCGRCHSYFFPKQEGDWWEHGFSQSYAPGQDLTAAQRLLSPEVLASSDAPALGAGAESLFYGDGTIRVGGREYNGLVRSPCYERGAGAHRLSCLSCHALHRGAPNDQLDPEKLGNGACTQCHARQGENVAAHTHHATSSSGSLCYNCHMPHTSYALLGAIRSHRVDSPSFDARTRDRPNACSLCHLEQSEAWAAAQTSAWYGSKASFVLDRADAELAAAPAGAVFALTGDAAVRAITAAALARHESSDDASALRAQLLQKLSSDDYAAVRSIAERARRSLRATSDASPPPLAPALMARLLAARDLRPVTIAE